MRGAIRCLFIVAAVTGAAGCDNHQSPYTPTPPSGTVQAVAITSNLTLSRPGDTGQLTARATLSDGTTKDVTADADWISTVSVVTVSKGGVATAVAYGSASITAFYRGKSSQAIPVVLKPQGSFLISGKVTAGGSALAQARVEATSVAGNHDATTDSLGRFTLPGAGDVTVRASRRGYEDTVTQVTVDRDTEVSLALRPDAQISAVLGSYRLTFTAFPSCTLPLEAMQRTYEAEVSHGGNPGHAGDFTVWLSDPSMVRFESGFTGSVDGSTVSFTISDQRAPYFIEQVGAMYMCYSGTATGAVSGRTIVATFNGKVRLTPIQGSTTIAEYSAADHRFEFVR